MIKKTVLQLASLFLTLAIVITVCGWVPFTAPVTISTSPEGASVYKEGGAELLGTTPYKTRIFHTEKRFVVKKEGFFDETVRLDYHATEHILVSLRALPVLLYTKPAADIYAADATKPMGQTPREMNVYLEDRSYTLKAADYFDKEVTIGLSTETPLVVELERRPIITLTTIPEGVEIFENEKLFATSTMTEEILEPRTFELKKEGYFSKTLELTSASDPKMTVALEALPVITIKTTPANAAIYLVGKSEPLGKGSVTLTVEKETAFEIKADRYYAETVTVEPKTQTKDVVLKAMPYVMIDSKPAGATVTIAGKATGTTPVEQLIEKSTAAELSLDGYQTKTVTLDSTDLKPVILLKEVGAAPVAQ